MNIEEMKLGDLLKLAQCLGGAKPDEETPQGLAQAFIGKPVIVRCHDAGVHFGILDAQQGREARLSKSRRLWHWKCAGGEAFLSGVARHGLATGSKVGGEIDIALQEICEIIPCTEDAAKNIGGFDVYTT